MKTKPSYMVRCPRCEGSGLDDLQPCKRCNGNGEVPVIHVRCTGCGGFEHFYVGRTRSFCIRCGGKFIRVDAMRE